MATKKQIEEFIEMIGPVVARQALAKGYKYPSAIIAQAIHESGVTSQLAVKYYNYFGMKCGSTYNGPSVKMGTKEYVKGVYVNCSANWRAYNSVEEGIEGYFNFLMMKRYQNLKSATSPSDYLNKIVADGWCTSPASVYVPKCEKYINDYNLKRFDDLRQPAASLGVYQVTCSALRVRRQPNTISDIVAKHEKGYKYQPIEQRMMIDGSIWHRTFEGWMCARLANIDYVSKLY